MKFVDTVCLSDSGTSGQLTVTGQDGLSQGQHRLQGLLGQIDEPIFTNVFAIGMRELQELSTLDDTSAADELYKLIQWPGPRFARRRFAKSSDRSQVDRGNSNSVR